MTFVEDQSPCDKEIDDALHTLDDCIDILITKKKIHSEHVLFALSLHHELYKIESLYNKPYEVQRQLQDTIDEAKSNARRLFEEHQKPWFDGINKIDSKVKRKLK